MDQLDKLAKLKLKMPKGIRSFIYNETSYKWRHGQYACVETMEKWRGQWILRVFAYRLNPYAKRTYSEIVIKEVQRKILGSKEYLVTGGVDSTMGGRRIYWSEDSKFYRVRKNWEFYGDEMYDENEIIEDLNIQYCSWHEYIDTHMPWESGLRFIDYLSQYIKEPRIERLVKLGLGKFVANVRYLDLSKRKIYDVFKIDRERSDIIKDLSISEIMLLRRQKDIQTLADLKLYQVLEERQVLDSLVGVKMKRILHYFKQQMEASTFSARHIMNIYADYLRFAKELGLPIKKVGVLLPVDLLSEHDRLESEVVAIELAENAEKFREHFERHKHHIYGQGEYTILPVKTQEDLIHESTHLDHCVRTYASDIANGETEILFVRKTSEIETPFVTVEVRGNVLCQAYGYNNRQPSDEVKTFLHQWSKKHKIAYKYC